MKRFIKYLILFGGTLLIINLSKNILHLLKAGEEVKMSEQRVLRSRQENQELKAQLNYSQSAEFVEKEARNKLNMSRPGETVVILPPDLGEKPPSVNHPDRPNYLKWWRLFF
jgi:cell division protein FtsB